MERLYALFDFAKMDENALARCLRLLPEDRQNKALGYHFERDQKASAAAYLLLLYALRDAFGLINPQVEVDARGKPYLKDQPQVHFNISHCPLGCVCAVADRPVGVDIQDVRPFSQRLAERCCTENELERLKTAADPAFAFARMWAMKESYVKKLGAGLGYDVRRVDTTQMEDRFAVFAHKDYCIAVSVQDD